MSNAIEAQAGTLLEFVGDEAGPGIIGFVDVLWMFSHSSHWYYLILKFIVGFVGDIWLWIVYTQCLDILSPWSLSILCQSFRILNTTVHILQTRSILHFGTEKAYILQQKVTSFWITTRRYPPLISLFINCLINQSWQISINIWLISAIWAIAIWSLVN